MYVSVLLACLVLVKVRRGHHTLGVGVAGSCVVCRHVSTENQLCPLEFKRGHHPLELKLEVLLIYPTRVVVCWEVVRAALEE